MSRGNLPNLQLSKIHFLIFSLLSCLSTCQRSKKVFAHYLPWYDSSGISFPIRTGWCYTGASNEYDCSDITIKHYSNTPLIGEYSMLDRDVIEYHLLLMHISGIDGIILNINPESDVQRTISILILDVIIEMEAKYSDFSSKIIVSYDDGGGVSDSSIPGLIQWVYTNIYDNSKYSEIIFVDPTSNQAVLMFWSESNNELYWSTAKSMFTSGVFILIRNARLWELSDGNFEWINDLNTDPNRANTQNWGEGYLNDFDWRMSRQSSDFGISSSSINYLKMGSIYPGFDDMNVPEFWNNGVYRYFFREVDDGETILLTWEKQISYVPLRQGGTDIVENPWLQITTWNDWPEGTSVEPASSSTYGYLPLERIHEKISDFKGVHNTYNLGCLRLPYSIYLERKNMNNDLANLWIDEVFKGNCEVSITSSPSPSASPSSSASISSSASPSISALSPEMPPNASPSFSTSISPSNEMTASPTSVATFLPSSTATNDPIETPAINPSGLIISSSSSPSPELLGQSSSSSLEMNALPSMSATPSISHSILISISPSASISPTSSVTPSFSPTPSLSQSTTPSPSSRPYEGISSCFCHCDNLTKFSKSGFYKACQVAVENLGEVLTENAKKDCKALVENLCDMYGFFGSTFFQF